MTKNKKRLDEDFLSDIEQKPVTAADIAGQPESTSAEDDDFADLLGGKTKSSSDQTQRESEVVDNLASTVKNFGDLVSNLTTSIQKLSDRVDNLTAPAPAPAPQEPAPAPAPAPAPEAPAQEAPAEAPANIDLDLDNAASAGSDENQNQQPAEDKPNTEDKPDTSDQDESAPGDETKSEAYRLNKKAGKLLNSNSGSTIGIVESGKLYKLDGPLMTIVMSKIRDRIEEAKKNLKAELLGEAVDMPKAEPQQIEEKEAPKEAHQMKSFLTFKNSKCCDGEKCSEEKKDDKKDDKKDEKSEKDDKKEEKENKE